MSDILKFSVAASLQSGSMVASLPLAGGEGPLSRVTKAAQVSQIPRLRSFFFALSP